MLIMDNALIHLSLTRRAGACASSGMRHAPSMYDALRPESLKKANSMTRFLSLADAVADYVHDGASVAMEGFTHLIPFAAGHEVIRQGKRDLTLIRMTPDLIYDQLIGMGCARKLIFSWGGNPGVGSLHRLRDAVEHGWPQPLALEEHSHAAMASAYAAGASGLPCAILRGYIGSDLVGKHPHIRFLECPFTGERLAAVPALRPDVGIIHAQRADRAGNVFIEGIIGVQKEVALTARQTVVTVEEIVDDLRPPSPNSVVLPHWTIAAVVLARGGARPSYAHGFYGRDNTFYAAWDEIARERETFLSWMREHVLQAAALSEAQNHNSGP
jgi:glutaconate CoA-transferase, subunit A